MTLGRYIFTACAGVLFALNTGGYAQTSTTAWSVAALDQILASVQPGQKTARIDDMEILVSNLRTWRNRLAGLPQPLAAIGDGIQTWPGGNIFYTFSNNVSVAKQKVFLDCAAEWSLFANLHFIPRTSQPNYITVFEDPPVDGGSSAVGMTGTQQFILLGSNGWSHYVICHEIGHALGLVHEHQRSDRDSYIMIITNNVMPGYMGLIKLTNTRNQTAYDFHSVMHYGAFTAPIDPTQPTMVPLPAYSQFAPVGADDPVLSGYDRAGMASIYGPGPILSSVVTNTQDSGLGSLRAALYYAYDHPGTVITFNIPDSDPGLSNGVFIIQVTDQLPCLRNATSLDGTTQPGGTGLGTPVVQLSDSLADLNSTSASGLRIRGTNCLVRGLILNGFQSYGVLIDSGAQSNRVGDGLTSGRNILSGNKGSGVMLKGTNTAANTVAGNTIGLDTSGSSAVPNVFYGVEIAQGATSNMIGGVGTGNVISGNGNSGIAIYGTNTGDNLIQGNYVGLSLFGSSVIGNGGSGIAISQGSQSNIIGGTIAGEGNIVAGNGGSGVFLGDPGTRGNAIQGNYVGVNAAGFPAAPNAFYGVEIASGATANTVGGEGARNVISGNGNSGVVIYGVGTVGNLIQANYIGLDPTGTALIGNGGSGIAISQGSQSNLIGGLKATLGNVVSGNGGSGVFLGDPGTQGNTIQGNDVGLNAAGSAAVPNAFYGVEIASGASNNMVGGTSISARNIISGNRLQGVMMYGTNTVGNIVQGNLIGLSRFGVAALGNGNSGIAIIQGSRSNSIGGTIAGAGNIVSGNGGSGIFLGNAGTSGNVIQGNFVGLDAAGSIAVPNSYYGVEIANGAAINIIGGIGGRNVISGNGNTGIAIYGGGTVANVVQGNTIGLNSAGTFAVPNAASGMMLTSGAQSNMIGGIIWGAPNIVASNAVHGIELWDATTSNNTVRANSIYGNGGVSIALNNGANRSASAPALISAVLTTNTTVSGNLTSFANTSFQIDFYSSPTSPAQGKTYLGAKSVMTSAGASVPFLASLPGHVPAGRIITATATDSAGSTSGMSGGVTVTTVSSVNDSIPDAWRAQYFGGSGTTTNNLSCATCDPDHDGMNNLQEFLAGTNPTNSASVLQLVAIAPNSSNNVAGFLSASGVVYRVKYCYDLSSGLWSLFADQILGTGTEVFITDPAESGAGNRFYRLQVLW